MSDFVEIKSAEELSVQITKGMENADNFVWSSFDMMADEESKVKAFNAMSDSGTALMDCNGKEIMVADVIIMSVTVQGESGDEVCPRTIILDEHDNIYTATSWGLYRSLQRMNALYGNLHFDPAKKAKVEVVKTKKGKTLNLKLVKG